MASVYLNLTIKWFLLVLLFQLECIKAENGVHQSYHSVQVSSLLPDHHEESCNLSPKGKRQHHNSLEVRHKHGPCSTLKVDKASLPSHVEILQNDEERVNSIRERVRPKSEVVDSVQLDKVPSKHRIRQEAVGLPAKSGNGEPANVQLQPLMFSYSSSSFSLTFLDELTFSSQFFPIINNSALIKQIQIPKNPSHKTLIMGLFSMTFAGGSFVLLGSWESLISTTPSSRHNSHRFSTITLISTASLSLLFLFDAFLSIFDAISSNDNLGTFLQLQILAISSLFLLFSLLGLLNFFSKSHNYPYPLLNLILLFAFLEEFLLFHLHLKDANGIENRYFDLMLVPILICVVATLIELINPDFGFSKLGRGLGLILQGTWFVQMGFAFFTDLIAHNCDLRYKSRGNYTIKCKSHMDSHRGGAIAVLLFNCHLAFLLALICGVVAVFGRKFAVEGSYSNYRPIVGGGDVMQKRVEDQGRFTLDSDSDDDGSGGEIRQEDGNARLKRENGAVELSVNGHGSQSVN